MVRGRITSAAGQPLQRVRVTLNGQSPNPPTSVTNAEGTFEITHVSAGTYSITASRAGYLTVQYGQRRPHEAGRTLEVHDGELVEHVDIALPRGAVLSGLVSDELGDPFPGARVEAVALRYTHGRRVPLQAGIATTNDLGEFRVSGLEPGTYYVRASTIETWADDDEQKGTHAYALTYFPRASGTDTAHSINVATGQEASSLDIQLSVGRAVRIDGMVQNSSAEPMPAQAVHLERITRGLGGALFSSSPGGSARTDGTGAFEIRDVPPGEYLLITGSSQTEFASLSLIVTDADVRGVVLIPQRGSTLKGLILTDEGTPPPFPPARVRIAPTATDENSVLPAWDAPRPQTVGSDWSFRFTNIDGGYLLRLTGLPDEWMLKAVRLNGRDVTDTPLEIPKGGSEVTGVQIVLTHQAAKVTGDVLDARGDRLGDSTVVVFAADRRLWTIGTRFVRWVRPDRAAHFAIGSLPAGTYFAIARDDVAEGQWEDPEFLDSLIPDATRFELSEAGSEKLTLTVKSDLPR
jgi:Carboxypeptidase regulatory-like domain